MRGKEQYQARTILSSHPSIQPCRNQPLPLSCKTASGLQTNCDIVMVLVAGDRYITPLNAAPRVSPEKPTFVQKSNSTTLIPKHYHSSFISPTPAQCLPPPSKLEELPRTHSSALATSAPSKRAPGARIPCLTCAPSCVDRVPVPDTLQIPVRQLEPRQGQVSSKQPPLSAGRP